MHPLNNTVLIATHQLELRLRVCYNLNMRKMCNNTNNRILWLILTLLQMGFIFFMSSRDAVHSSSDSLGITKWLCSIFLSKNMSVADRTQIIESIHGWIRMGAHFTEFAVLGLFLFLCLRGVRHVISIAWILGIIYAISDEIHQYFVPGRACEITDIIIDSVGVICGIIIAFIIEHHILMIKGDCNGRRKMGHDQ